MTRPPTINLTLVLFFVSALGGCGTDPYVGATHPAGSGGVTTGAGGSSMATGGSTGAEDASTAELDAGVDVSDAPDAGPTISYRVSISPSR